MSVPPTQGVAVAPPQPPLPVAGAPAPSAAGARPPGAPPAARLRYVDQLRVLAVVGVVAIHVSEVFNPWDEWHIVDAQRSRVIGEIVVLMAPWIMPLFMLLAGVSAWFSLLRRGNGAYVRERVLRVLMPFAVGTLVLVPPQVWLERRMQGRFDGSLWQFYPHFFEGIYPRGNLSWHHLWFLAHLFVYSVLALPLFRFWQHARGRAQLHRVSRLCSGPGGLLWLALPLIVERHLLWGLFPERLMLTSDWSNHALLFVAYLYGFVLAGERWVGEAIDEQWRWALVGAVGSTAILVAGTWHDILPWRVPAPYSPGYLVFWTLYAVGAWSWMVALLGMGRRWLRRDSRFFDYGRSVGYGWYLVHQPVIVAAAYFVVQWRAPIAVKFAALAALAVAGTLLGAEALRRIPGIQRALGVRGVA